MEFAGFDWDEGNWQKCQQHGVSIKEIEWLFEHDVQIRPDIAHSQTEERLRGIGKNADGRYVFVTFTIRTVGDKQLIRPINVRYMHQKEIKNHVEAAARTYH